MTLGDRESSEVLRDSLGLLSIRNCRGRLRSFGHVGKMDKNSWIKKCVEIVVEEHEGDLKSVEYVACCSCGQ